MWSDPYVCLSLETCFPIPNLKGELSTVRLARYIYIYISIAYVTVRCTSLQLFRSGFYNISVNRAAVHIEGAGGRVQNEGRSIKFHISWWKTFFPPMITVIMYLI